MNTRRAVTTLTLAAALAVSADRHAPAAEAEQTDEMEIVVTARPLRPDAVVVDEEEITSSPGDSLADVLHWSGVIDIYRRGSGQAQADLGFRASTFEQTGVFIDGVPVRAPQTGHFLLDLPLGGAELEAVEVSALPWGPDGLAGSVNIVLKPPAEKRLELEAGAGDYGLWRAGLAASTPGAGVWGAFEHSDGYRPDTDYDSFSAGAVVEMKEFLSSRALVAWSSRRFGANDFYAPYLSWEETETALATWRGRTDSGPWTTEPSLSYRRYWDRFVLERDNPTSSENIHTSHAFGGAVGFTRGLSAGRLRVSFEGRGASLVSTALGERDWSAGGISTSLNTSGEDVDADVGLRFDAHSQYSAQVCPLLSLKWRPYERLALRASASRAFREPSFTELYYPDLGGNVGNPDLEVESAWNLGLATEWRTDGFEAAAKLFARREDSLIDWVKDDPSDPQWQPMNIGESNVLGAEARVTLGRSHGRLGFSYAYLDRDADYGGKLSKYALNFPEHRLEARGSLSAGPWHTSVRLGYFSRTDGQEYTLLDGGVSFSQDRWEAFVSFTNLFDEDYKEVGGVPMPGVCVRGGVRCRF